MRIALCHFHKLSCGLECGFYPFPSNQRRNKIKRDVVIDYCVSAVIIIVAVAAVVADTVQVERYK